MRGRNKEKPNWDFDRDPKAVARHFLEFLDTGSARA